MKYLKYAAGLIVLIAVAIAGILTYVKVALPDVGEAEDIKIEYTMERIERGRYLANSVAVCMDCHSKRDWTKFSGPLTPGTLGQGGERFDQTMGLPGVFHSKNITPFAISRYTDGELFRVITTGVTKEGRAMFPLMPYPYYGRMDREDIYDIIAYIRSIPSIEKEIESSVADFPVNFIINTMPKRASHQTRPPKSDVLAYGAYLTNAGGCAECHTPVKQGVIIPEVIYGGGRDFQFPDGSVLRSSNISPDMASGIGEWSEDLFVSRFKTYADSAYVTPEVKPGEFNSLMPWTMYAQMETDDLKAIYAYLMTVKPISNKVERFVPASGK